MFYVYVNWTLKTTPRTFYVGKTTTNAMQRSSNDAISNMK